MVDITKEEDRDNARKKKNTLIMLIRIKWH